MEFGLQLIRPAIIITCINQWWNKQLIPDRVSTFWWTRIIERVFTVRLSISCVGYWGLPISSLSCRSTLWSPFLLLLLVTTHKTVRNAAASGACPFVWCCTGMIMMPIVGMTCYQSHAWRMYGKWRIFILIAHNSWTRVDPYSLIQPG